MKKKMWFVMSSQDDELDFSHDWGGEFYYSKEEAESRVEELKEGCSDVDFEVRMGTVDVPVKGRA
jgi:hypothetical protein